LKLGCPNLKALTGTVTVQGDWLLLVLLDHRPLRHTWDSPLWGSCNCSLTPMWWSPSCGSFLQIQWQILLVCDCLLANNKTNTLVVKENVLKLELHAQ
jgi:hypothetical protein